MPVTVSAMDIGDWVRAHDELLRIARERGELEGREGKALLWAMRSGVHVHLGYGSFVEYVERLLGHAPRTTLDKLRTAEALESLPALERALTLGEASWSAVRELARVARPETEREWLEAAKGRTVREIERLVVGRKPGERPSDPARPLSERYVLRFEVAAETVATFRQAMKVLRQLSGGHLEDDEALLLMARCVLGGRGVANDTSCARSNDGRASYQLALTLCERCRRGFQEANSEQLEVDPAIIDMARCDAQHIGHVGTRAEPAAAGKRHAATVGKAAGQLEGAGMLEPGAAGYAAPAGNAAAAGKLELAAAGNAAAAAGNAERETATPRTHVGLSLDLHLPSRRATQTISPALRRQVLCRDSSRCVVPGCRHATFVDLHHLQSRLEGGRHEADNLVVLCSAHHRAVHCGRLTISGRASTGLRVQHVDGSAYGIAPAPQTIDTLGKVFRALCRLGFKEREARQALDAVTAVNAHEPATATAEELLRAALQTLAPASVRRRAGCRV